MTIVIEFPHAKSIHNLANSCQDRPELNEKKSYIHISGYKNYSSNNVAITNIKALAKMETFVLDRKSVRTVSERKI